MGLFDKVKKTTIESRRYEEKLYEVALEEVEAGEVRKGLYAKAVAKADGDKEKADGIYLKLRVQSITDDIESDQIDRRDNERAYKALQELRNAEAIEAEAGNEITLKSAIKKLKHTKYTVNQGFWSMSFIIRNQKQDAFNNIVYKTHNLDDLHKWIDKNTGK
jgi:hypothetical protein